MSTDTQPGADAPQPDPQEEGIDESMLMAGHKYDGIQEYDNPMPGWWTGIFLITVLFVPVYMLGISTFGFVDDYEEDLSQATARLTAVQEAYAAANPTEVSTDAASLIAMAADPGALAAGAEVYKVAGTCAICHGQEGEGGIGPNLADNAWIHGGSPEDIYKVVNEGVLTAGMPAWGEVLTQEQIVQASAYVISLQGTTPANPKEPQGEVYSGS
jgi:cytochrome c oxidase cbb3-type subunit 3